MAFHLIEGESLSTGLRRISIEQIDRGREVLTQSEDRDEAIHAVRKCFKKLRAILRLVREEIGDEIFVFENRFFRNLGRSLATERDVASVREAVDRLLGESDDEPARLLLERVKSRLDEKQGSGDADELDATIADVITRLEEARERSQAWPIERNRFAAIDRGLKRVYKDGRRAYGEITGEPTDGNLHEWRKQVKYLWYVIRILEPVWSAVLDAMVHELHALSDVLGDDHDLAMLRSMLHDSPDIAGGDDDTAMLLALIGTRRAALQEKAKSLGSRIYSERPKAFIRRMQGYWKSWREEVTTD